MHEKILKRKVKRQDFYKVYLQSLNGYLSLTKRELEVLVGLCNIQAQQLDKNYTPELLSKVVFGPVSRELIRTHLNISPYNLNNIIKVLKGKGVIKTSEDDYYYLNPQLYIPLIDKEYLVQFNFEVISDE